MLELFTESHMAIIIKNPDQLNGVRAAGRIAAEILDLVTPQIIPGISTGEINDLCTEYMRKMGVSSATLDYAPNGHTPYPKSICTSVNHQVCHGIPSHRKQLKDGDILNIDITVIKDGYFGDTGRMFCVGTPHVLAQRICKVARECLWAGINSAKAGNRLGDIGHAIQTHAEKNGFSVVREYCGHGVGVHFHEEPQILHYGQPGKGLEIAPGMTFTIEPMINAGKRHVKILGDGWTVVTKDRSLSAQWEHMLFIAKDRCEVLTLSRQEREQSNIQ